MKRYIIFLGVVLVALIAIGIAHLVSEHAKENARGKESLQSTPSPRVVSPPVISPCGPGLAAQDLAGVCRAKPNPTPGALEAMRETKQSKIKNQSKSTSEKLLRSF